MPTPSSTPDLGTRSQLTLGMLGKPSNHKQGVKEGDAANSEGVRNQSRAAACDVTEVVYAVVYILSA